MYWKQSRLILIRISLDCFHGEILYLPAGWHHATVNLEMTVAVALVRAQSIEFLGPEGYLYKE